MILRPVSADWRQLLKSHSEAIRIAETRLSLIDHPEVARALEQELICALVNCLSNAAAFDPASNHTKLGGDLPDGATTFK